MRILSPTLVMLTALLTCALSTSSARADGRFGPHPDYAPSVLSYAMDGLQLGLLVGVAGGYLYARDDGFKDGEWRPFVLGGGIGALAGTGLGLTLGFVDLASDNPGRGSIALRDTLWGSGLGLLLGAITGALVMISSDEPEHIGLGAAIGTLAGAGGGLVIGLIEGSRIVTSPAHRYPGLNLRPSMATLRDSNGSLVAAPGFAARF